MISTSWPCAVNRFTRRSTEKVRQIVVTKRRYPWLRHHLGRIGLRELARFKDLIKRVGQAQLGLTLGGRQSNDSLSPSSDHPDHFYRELFTFATVVRSAANAGYPFARVGRRDGR
jgi:hypothetical protein